MSDTAFDVSLTAEGERSMGEGDGGVRGVSSGPLRATTNSTSPRAFCRMLMACWWEMLESSGWPSIARIWSPSRSLPSLQHNNHGSQTSGTKQFQIPKKKCNKLDLRSYREIDVITSKARVVLLITQAIASRNDIMTVDRT